MRKILSFLMLSIFVNLYAQFDVKITNIVIDKTYLTNPTQFALPNNEASYSVKINYTVNLTDKQNAYAIHGLNFKVNGQVYAVMNTGLTTNSNYPYSGQAQYNLNIGSPSAIDFMVELPYHKQVFPVGGTEYNKSNTWRLNFYKPLSNNSISSNSLNYDYNDNLSISLNGSLPTGGNGEFSYKWYKKKWDEQLFSEIPNSNNKNINYAIKESTKFIRTVYSANTSSDSNILDIKVVNNSKLSRRNYIKSSPLNSWDDYCVEIPYLSSCPNVKENTSIDIKKGDNVSFYGSEIQIEGIANPNQGSLWTYQWQIDKLDGLGWQNINGAINKDYTTGIINVKSMFRRLAFSQHYITNPLVSDNEITVNVYDSNPVDNNNISIERLLDPEIYIENVLGSTLSGGDDLNYEFTWYADCLPPGFSIGSSTPLTKIHTGFGKNYKNLPNGFTPPNGMGTLYSQDINTRKCPYGITIMREAKFNGFSSRSNIVKLYSDYPQAILANNNGDRTKLVIRTYNITNKEIYVTIVDSQNNSRLFKYKIPFILLNNSYTYTIDVPDIYWNSMPIVQIKTNDNLILYNGLYLF
ncbi:hypothetical protein HX001_12020 [Empedobacter brevis]|uniref:Uncharacterized protein n=1 Tax=Empedobacter brevis TaxID=247 RepID=A0AAJ1QFQ6_9FLAO|nr:hypothetical protein [Empedobacter brevis]MDM1073210.1 hypothetical protein [Empedobacter brevis]